MSSNAPFSGSVSSVSVQSNSSRSFLDSALSVGLGFHFSFNSYKSMGIRVCIGIQSSVSTVTKLGCYKIGSAALQFWLTFSMELVEKRSLIRITFQEQTEDYRICWFNELGLPSIHYGKLGNFCVSPDCVSWFDCVGHSDWYFFVE